MKYRRLGGTDLDVSVICLGPMRAAAKNPGDDDKSKAGELALRKALDEGVNFIHSSYEYGTRWMMSRVLKDHPLKGELHHVIKVPVPDFEDGNRFDAGKFRLRIEEALVDLHAERIDVIQWMWRSTPNTDERRVPMVARIMDDVMAAFEQMRNEGKAGYLMTFPYTVACARAAIDMGKLAGLIAYYNVIEMEMAEFFAELKDRNMGFIAIRPLYQGILTDERADRESLRPDDRLADAQHADDFARRAKVAEVFQEEIGNSMTSFAVRFALAHPLVASVVVGINTPEQAAGMVAAADEEPLPIETVQKARELW
jgi:aryl-alcohol dehydrogenase-like predicted oxidoreductase